MANKTNIEDECKSMNAYDKYSYFFDAMFSSIRLDLKASLRGTSATSIQVTSQCRSSRRGIEHLSFQPKFYKM